MDKNFLGTLRKYNDSELKKAKKFAFMPTGVLGVHDFMVGRITQGIMHIIISVFCFVFCNGFGEMICKSVGNCKTTNNIDVFYRTMLIFGVMFLIGSWIWAFLEGIKIDEILLERHRTPQQKAAEEKRAKMEKLKNRLHAKKVFAILSIITGAILVIGDLMILMERFTLPSCHDSGCGAVLMMSGIATGFFMYIVSPILSVLAVIFGVVGIGKKENQKFRWSAIIGLAMGILGGIFAILLIIFITS